jgi:F0F1-type ATP synthase membrane subunit b/b'
MNRLMSDIRKNIENTGKNIQDSIDESMHRSAADAEKMRREVEGDQMSAGEKLRSGLDEAKHRTEAEMDHVKREMRGDPTTKK